MLCVLWLVLPTAGRDDLVDAASEPARYRGCLLPAYHHLLRKGLLSPHLSSLRNGDSLCTQHISSSTVIFG
jgi:hypothetical protein